MGAVGQGDDRADTCEVGFCGIGKWAGTAEVFDGRGRFISNATDQRFARTVDEDGRVRIDLAFVGPLKFAGHYTIEDNGGHRIYQGPANTGSAESVGPDAVDANSYWPVTGLSQRFFLAKLPSGDRQLHLSLMSRGDRPLYTIVGESHMVPDDGQANVPGLIPGISHDLAADPGAGRGTLLIQRSGTWSGAVRTFDGQLRCLGDRPFEERVVNEDDRVRWSLRGSLAPDDLKASFHTDGWLSWSELGGTVGSFALYGGRALSGSLHHISSGLRVCRREICTSDGTTKAILHTWYRGGLRVGVQQGFLTFTPNP